MASKGDFHLANNREDGKVSGWEGAVLVLLGIPIPGWRESEHSHHFVLFIPPKKMPQLQEEAIGAS